MTARSVFAMGYLGQFGSIIGFTAYVWLLRNVEPKRVATYAYVNPVVAVFLGSSLGGETLAPELLAGSALVVLGIVLIVTFRSKPQLSPRDALARSHGDADACPSGSAP